MVVDRVIDVMDALAKDETFHPIERQDTSNRLCDKLWQCDVLSKASFSLP